MEIRELKKEVHKLECVEKNVNSFQEHWVKPIKSNTNKHLPFLKNLPHDLKSKLNNKLLEFHKVLAEVKEGAFLHSKLQSYTRYLVQMKLNSLRGDHSNSRFITNYLLNDEVLNMKRTIEEIKSFEKNVQNMSEQYHEINELLHKHLSLEEALFLMELPHKKYIYNLIQTSKNQKKIVRHIGRHFVSLAKKSKLGK